jgi:hypothetical protein
VGRSGRGGEEKNSQLPPGIESSNPNCPARSLVAIPTEQSRLQTKIYRLFIWAVKGQSSFIWELFLFLCNQLLKYLNRKGKFVPVIFD